MKKACFVLCALCGSLVAGHWSPAAAQAKSRTVSQGVGLFNSMGPKQGFDGLCGPGAGNALRLLHAISAYHTHNGTAVHEKRAATGSGPTCRMYQEQQSPLLAFFHELERPNDALRRDGRAPVQGKSKEADLGSICRDGFIEENGVHKHLGRLVLEGVSPHFTQRQIIIFIYRNELEAKAHAFNCLLAHRPGEGGHDDYPALLFIVLADRIDYMTGGDEVPSTPDKETCAGDGKVSSDDERAIIIYIPNKNREDRVLDAGECVCPEGPFRVDRSRQTSHEKQRQPDPECNVHGIRLLNCIRRGR